MQIFVKFLQIWHINSIFEVFSKGFWCQDGAPDEAVYGRSIAPRGSFRSDCQVKAILHRTMNKARQENRQKKCKNICTYQKNVVLLQRKSLNNTIMAQETLDSLIQVMFTLSLPEQEKVIERMQANVRQLTSKSTPYTMEEIDARLDESERDIEEGRYYTTEEVFHPHYAVAI